MSVAPGNNLSTPEQNNVKTTGSRSISKNLLTPCRRLGLSKKSKTSSSKVRGSPVIAASPSYNNQSYGENKACNEVLQTHKYSLKDAKEDLNKHGNAEHCQDALTPIRLKSKRQLINDSGK